MESELNLKDAQSLAQKLSEFSQNSLNPNERKMLGAILTVYEKAVSKENAPVIFGEDSGFLEEIESASENSGEVNAMVTPVIVRTTIIATTIILTGMSGDDPKTCKK